MAALYSQKGHRVKFVSLTNGDADSLFATRNGVFYDREGKDWDATVTKVVSNPISVRAAFWSPYKKLVKTIEDTVAKRAQASEARAGGVMEADLPVQVLEVGERLGISSRTAKAHSDVLRQKLGVTRRRQIPVAYRALTGDDPLSRSLKSATVDNGG